MLGNLPSRAADNLFWFGRYLERAEATLRLVRCLCAKSVESIDCPATLPAHSRGLVRMLIAWGVIPATLADAATPVIAARAMALGGRLWFGALDP